jgi:hypothetical protein
MTTMYRNGRFWVIDAVTGGDVETFSSFATWQAARDAVGSAWCDSTLAADESLEV